MMLESLRRGAIKDGISEEWADIIVYAYQDKSVKEMASLLGRDYYTSENILRAVFKHFKVGTKAQLIVKCAPYIKGEKVS